MSEVEGKFKAKAIKFETTTDPELPFLRCLFILTDQWSELDQEWESIVDRVEESERFCSHTYWLQKVAKSKDAKMSPLEFAKMSFKSAWGFELGAYPELADLNNAIRDKEKILILENSEGKYHKIKYVNSLSGKVKEGMVDLGSMLK